MSHLVICTSNTTHCPAQWPLPVRQRLAAHNSCDRTRRRTSSTRHVGPPMWPAAEPWTAAVHLRPPDRSRACAHARDIAPHLGQQRPSGFGITVASKLRNDYLRTTQRDREREGGLGQLGSDLWVTHIQAENPRILNHSKSFCGK